MENDRRCQTPSRVATREAKGTRKFALLEERGKSESSAPKLPEGKAASS